MVVVLLLAAALVAPLVIWREPIAALFVQRERVAAAIRGAGGWGPVLLIALTVAQVIAAPIPGQAVNFVAGYLYGFWLGSLYSWLGMMIGSTAAMALARVVGRLLVARLVNPARLDRLDRLAAGRGLGFFFLVFLIPGLPDDAACFLAGLTPLPLPALIAAAAVGRSPGIVASVWAGAYAERLSWQGWLIGGGISLVAAVLLWRYGRQIQDELLRCIAGFECALMGKQHSILSGTERLLRSEVEGCAPNDRSASFDSVRQTTPNSAQDAPLISASQREIHP